MLIDTATSTFDPDTFISREAEPGVPAPSFASPLVDPATLSDRPAVIRSLETGEIVHCAEDTIPGVLVETLTPNW